MPKLVDLSGRKYGRVTVIRRHANYINRFVHWDCICDCGVEFVTRGQSLTLGRTQSCGCKSRERVKAMGEANKKHGMRNTQIYHIWSGIARGRTTRGYSGVKTCDRWRKFENFYADMGPMPSPEHSIDRIDGAKGYSPENCRWATVVEQNNNKRTNRVLEFNGERRTVAEWARHIGINYETLLNRVTRHGWSVERALTTLGDGRACPQR